MPKIMLVEDDNNLREIYEARLQAEGYTLIAAKDGEEALVLAKNEKPDLIISDVMMPKISGFEMLDILRNTEGLKEVKIIMLTALGQSDDQQRADRLGADRYLVKSQVTLEDIVKVAHDLLQDTPAASEVLATVEPTTFAPAPVAETPTPVVPAAPAAPALPQPVANVPEPMATPVVPAEPTTPVQPATPDPVATTPPTDTATTAQEEASMASQIESFVEGASSVPTAPTDSPIVANAPVVEAVPPAAVAVEPAALPVTPPVASNDTAAHDDQVMAQAMSDLSTSTTLPAAPTITLAATSEPVTSAPVASSDAVASTPPTPTANGSVPIAHKKIISPIDSEPKQDINTLLALEEAKEAATAPPAPPTAIVASNETVAQAQPLAVPTANTNVPLPTVAPAADAPVTPQTFAAPATDPAAAPPAPAGTTNPIDPNSIAL